MTTKLLKAPLLAILLCGLPLVAADDSKTAKVPKDKFFVGAGLGLGGYGIGGPSVSAGYIHYFPKDTFIDNKFRQGIRAYGSVGFSYESVSDWSGTLSYLYLPVIVGADYLLDFNPGEKFVWGIFAGAGLGFRYAHISYESKYYGGLSPSGPSSFGIAYAIRAGGSLTINNTHRIDVSSGFGMSYFGVNYSFLF